MNGIITPVFVFVLALLLIAATILAMLILDLTKMPSWMKKRRRNTRRYICLDPYWRQKSLFDWLTGGPNVQRVLANLPAELEELDVSGTDIASLPALLPSGLKTLSARNCRNLKGITALPDSIEVLDFWGCEALSQLPESLPKSLKELYVVGTALTALPKLPSGLQQFDARCSSQLAQLHSDWPEFRISPEANTGSLHWLNLCGTPASKTVTGNLPEVVLTQVRTIGHAGWRMNSAWVGSYHFAGQPMPAIRIY